MKKTIKLILTLWITCGLFFISGCDKSSPSPTEAERVATILKKGSWKIVTVTIDNTLGNSYAGMTLSFTSSGYSATNGAPVWPASGTWTFTNDTAKVLKRDDGLEVTIEAIDDAGLVLSLSWSKTTLGKGRTQSISGKHVFVFIR